MAVTLTKGASVLALPDDMLWVDEFDWSPVVAHAGYGAAGALLVDRSTRLAGRPITLSGPWVTRTTVETLYTWAADEAAAMTLVLRSLTCPVCFDYEKGPPVQATPVFIQRFESGDFYRLTLRLLKKD